MNNWTWFSRSGAIIVLIGALLSARRQLRIGVVSDLMFFGKPAPENETPDQRDERIEKGEMELSKDVFAINLGLPLILIGTIIWAYGDLLNNNIFNVTFY